jgi:hypothetical protein
VDIHISFGEGGVIETCGTDAAVSPQDAHVSRGYYYPKFGRLRSGMMSIDKDNLTPRTLCGGWLLRYQKLRVPKHRFVPIRSPVAIAISAAEAVATRSEKNTKRKMMKKRERKGEGNS